MELARLTRADFSDPLFFGHGFSPLVLSAQVEVKCDLTQTCQKHSSHRGAQAHYVLPVLRSTEYLTDL
jgi:hypothetical protein